MNIATLLKDHFPALHSTPQLVDEIAHISEFAKFGAQTVLLDTGAYIKVIPLLVKGLIKVYKEEPEQGNEVLLYYIAPGESCIVSVLTNTKNEPSAIKAVVEQDAEIILIPAPKAIDIAKKYPQWNSFFYQLFDAKYHDLLHSIELLTFSKKDKLLLEYLEKEMAIKKTKTIYKTHQEIAYELGSSREVISRLLKRLEHQGKIMLKQGEIIWCA